MITPESYFQLVREAARLCGEKRGSEALAVLLVGGISTRMAREHVASMLAAGEQIRECQEQDRELRRWGDMGADRKRCMVLTTNGTTPVRAAREVDCLWETVVRKALEETAYTMVFRRGLDEESLAVQAIGKADLLVIIFTEDARELAWVLNFAQAWRKPLVPLAPDGCRLNLALPLTSSLIPYAFRQTSEGFELNDFETLFAAVKNRILNPNEEEAATSPEGRSIHGVARQIYGEPFARNLRDTVCRGKLRALHQFSLRLEDAREMLRADYEIEQGATAATLSPFAEILTESARILQSDYQCLHKAMQDAISGLPEKQQEEGLKVCAAMKVLLQDASDFIDHLKTADCTLQSAAGREEAIRTLEAEIARCCRLIPDRAALFKAPEPTNMSVAPLPEDPPEVLFGMQEVETSFSEFRRNPNVAGAKIFCRAIRAALFRWLGLDDREQGAYDEPARRILQLGEDVAGSLEQKDSAPIAPEIVKAIHRHVKRFYERLNVDVPQRIRNDYAALVNFVRNCQ